MTEQMDLLEQGRAEVDAICALIEADPLHSRDKAAVVEAIKRTADENDGIVDQNLVRPLVPSWVYPKVVGSVYRVLRQRGVLAYEGWNTSFDTKGRNSGKPQRRYRWIGAR